VDTYVGVSKVAGIGTFATHRIRKGTVIWVYHPKFDQAYTREELDRLPEASRKHIEVYKYLSDVHEGKYIVCMDGARHFNHSWDPNTHCPSSIELTPEQRSQLTPEQWADVDPHEKITIALRDIEADEEISCDYEIDFPDPKDKTHGFLDDIRYLKHQK